MILVQIPIRVASFKAPSKNPAFFWRGSEGHPLSPPKPKTLKPKHPKP